MRKVLPPALFLLSLAFTAYGQAFGTIQEQTARQVEWQMHDQQPIFYPPETITVQNILSTLYGKGAPQHGDPGGFQYADIPAEKDAGWVAAPLDPADGQLYFRPGKSKLDRAWAGLDFAYFQTSVTIRDTTRPFIIRYDRVDDGVRAYVFNAKHPKGAFLPDIDKTDKDPTLAGDARLYGVSPERPKRVDLRPLLVEGPNRIVLVYFDNAPTESVLKVVVE